MWSLACLTDRPRWVATAAFIIIIHHLSLSPVKEGAANDKLTGCCATICSIPILTQHVVLSPAIEVEHYACVCSTYSAELISNAVHHTNLPLKSTSTLAGQRMLVFRKSSLADLFQGNCSDTCGVSHGSEGGARPHRSRPPPVLQCYKSLSWQCHLSLMSNLRHAVLGFRNSAAQTLENRTMVAVM